MKNSLKPAIWIAAVAILSACGSGQAPIVNMGQNGYNANTGWNTGYNWNPNGGSTQSIPGGTQTILSVVGGTMQTGQNRVLVGGAQVQAGDQIRVNASNGGVAGVSTGFFQVSGSLYLTALRVSVNGNVLGTGLTGQYVSPQGGTLQVSFEATGWPTSNYDLYQVSLPYGAVSIVRCRDTSNQPMNCPY